MLTVCICRRALFRGGREWSEKERGEKEREEERIGGDLAMLLLLR